MLGFAVAGRAPRTVPSTTPDAPSERDAEPARIVDGMHGFSHGAPR
jgi:hypothetical protein